MNVDAFPSQLVCAVKKCDAVPHIVGTRMGRGVPKDSTSGAGLIIDVCCEKGHCFAITFSDHSGGIWIHVHMQNDDTAFMAFMLDQL